MADQKDIQNQKDLNSELKETNKLQNDLAASAQRAKDRVSEYALEIKKAGKDSGDMASSFTNAQKDVTSLANSMGKMAAYSKEDLKDSKKRAQYQKDIAAVAQKRAKIESRIAANNVMMANATEEEAENYKVINEQLLNSLDTSEGIQEKFQGISEEIDKINKGSNFATKLADGVKDIPGLGPLLAGPIGDMAKGIDAMNVGIKDGKEGVEVMAMLTGGLMKSAFIFIAKAAFDADKSTTNMAKQLGISKDEAQEISNRFNDIALKSGDSTINASKLKEAFSQLGGEVGAVVGFTDEQITMQSKLTKLVGLESSEAAKLTKFAIGKDKSTKKATIEILDQVAALEKETGIRLDGRKVLKEVANINGNLAASYKFNTAELARAVTQANKLGLSLEKTSDISRNLLDFEESIAAEMSAELMLGRDLELSKARSLALDGKSAEAVAELAKNFGSAKEFSQLNVLAREDLAKAMGMEVNELADSIKKQELLNKLGEKSIADAASTEAGRKRLIELGGEELLNQYEQQSAADKFADTMANLQSAVGEIANGFMPLIDIVATIASNATLLKSVLIGIGAVSFAGTLAKLGTMLVGLSANAAAAMATASAITLGLGMIAVIGGIAAGMAAVNKAKNEAKADSSIKDGIIGPGGEVMVSGPKGSVNIDSADSMLVGTNLGGGGGSQESKKTNQLLERILMKQGTVEMDGNKVGTAFAVGSYSLQ
jgi:hypothetical protein